MGSDSNMTNTNAGNFANNKAKARKTGRKGGSK